MENTEQNNTEQTNSAPQPRWFHNVWIGRGTLLVAGLLFCLPFMNINCSGTKLASIRGIDMVVGSELKPQASPLEDQLKTEVSSAFDSLATGLNAIGDSLSLSLSQAADSLAKAFGNTGDPKLDSFHASIDAEYQKTRDSINAAYAKEEDSLKKAREANNNTDPFGLKGDIGGLPSDKKIEPNILAIFSLGALVLALVFSFFSAKAMKLVTAILTALSCLALFFIQVQVTSELQKQLGPMNFIPITVEFTSFYWLAILFLTIATIFSFIRGSLKTS